MGARGQPWWPMHTLQLTAMRDLKITLIHSCHSQSLMACPL